MNIEIPDENNINEKAVKMSEGNSYLKDALVNLWNNNIKVVSCTVGDKKNGVYPNISILIDKHSASLVKKVYDIFFELFKENFQINFFNFEDEKGYNYIMNISVKYNYVNALFALFTKLYEEEKIKELEENEFVSYIMNLIAFCSIAKKNARVSVIHNNMILIVEEENTNSTKMLKLSDCIDDIEKKNSMEYGTYECDNDSIIKLVNIIHKINKGHQKIK